MKKNTDTYTLVFSNFIHLLKLEEKINHYWIEIIPVCWDGPKWSFLCTHVFWNVTLKHFSLGGGVSFSSFVSGLDLGFLFAWTHRILGSSTSSELTQMHSFLWLRHIPLCICTALLYSFICWQTSTLLPWSSYCSAAMNNGTHVSSSILVSSGYMPRSGIDFCHQVFCLCFPLRVGDGQESHACCSPWSHKVSDMTGQLNLIERSTLWRWENLFQSSISLNSLFLKIAKDCSLIANYFSAGLIRHPQTLHF